MLSGLHLYALLFVVILLSRAIEKCRLIAIEKCRSVAIVESTLKLRSIEPGGQARRSAKC
jgi:hypothetical protein